MTIESLDRTIYELLRLEFVRLGYLPDIAAMTDIAEYNAAKDTIRSEKDYVVEVMGVGNGQSRDAKALCMVTVDRPYLTQGAIGGVLTYVTYKNPDGSFTRVARPASSSDVGYNVRVSGATAKMDRIMIAAVLRCLGYNLATKAYNSDTNKFDSLDWVYLEGNGYVDMSDGRYLDRLFTYGVKDVWVDEGNMEATIVPAMTSIEFQLDLYNNKHDDWRPEDKEYTINVDVP